MKKLLRKVIAGGPSRKSRLHDARGNRVDLGGLLGLPVSCWSAAARLGLGYRMRRPWIGYRAATRLAQLLGPEKAVLEFGAGMSTAWFAQRAARVVSIEADAGWHRRIRHELGRAGLRNVDCRHVQEMSAYSRPAVTGAFDLVVIDGAARARCAEFSLSIAQAGAAIFLDNSDVELEAAEILELAAARGGWSVEYFVDFVPGYVSVTQGMLVMVR